VLGRLRRELRTSVLDMLELLALQFMLHRVVRTEL
jgi:hypothetical protein